MPTSKIAVNEAALKRAAKTLRKLRLTTVYGDKEHPTLTVASGLKDGLGGWYDPEAVDYILRAGVRYYLKELEIV